MNMVIVYGWPQGILNSQKNIMLSYERMISFIRRFGSSERGEIILNLKYMYNFTILELYYHRTIKIYIDPTIPSYVNPDCELFDHHSYAYRNV